MSLNNTDQELPLMCFSLLLLLLFSVIQLLLIFVGLSVRLVSRRLAAPLLNNLTHLPGLQCRSVTHACGVAVRLQVFSGFVSQTVAAAAVKVANR